LHTEYFKSSKNSPETLRHFYKRQIRFEEVDQMGIVWHGRYPGYFEESRVAFGRKYGISYSDFMLHKHPVPIRKISVDYLAPLYFEDEIEIETIMHWSQAAKMNYEYIIRKKNGVVCTGFTVQLMLDTEFNLLLQPPDFYQIFIDKWQRGEFAQ